MASTSELDSEEPVVQVPSPPSDCDTGNKRLSNKNRIARGRNRWDQTPEEVQSKWKIAFDSQFSKFVTDAQPHDQWTITLDKVTKNHPLRTEKRWHRFLGEKAVAGFICAECGKVWESMKGWVAFWIWQNEPGVDGKLQGGIVTAHILGQKCFRCPGSWNSKKYNLGDLQGDEIDAVLSFLLMEIDYWFYGNDTYTSLDEDAITDRRPPHPQKRFCTATLHVTGGCQACKFRVCNKTLAAKNNPVDPQPEPVLVESKRRRPKKPTK